MALRELSKKILKSIKDLSKNLIINNEIISTLLKNISVILQEADIPVDIINKLIKNLKKNLLNNEEFKKHANKEKLIRDLLWKEIYNMLDPKIESFKLRKGKCNIIMFVGLQGCGKTTTITKFAYYFKRKKWKCALVCADTFRAGAFDQLKQNATKVSVPFYGSYTEVDPVKIAVDGVKQFVSENYELILVDTSGRHKQERGLFKEMDQIVQAIKPNDIVFVIDGTIGQAAMSQTKAFKKAVNIGSCIVTKLDGNNKGGGALAAIAATKSPITFIGNGEHFMDFDEFSPKGFASRLVGYGDPYAFLRKIESVVDKKKQYADFKRILNDEVFTMRDFQNNLKLLLKMGLIEKSFDLISPQMINVLFDGNLSFTSQIYLTIMDSMSNKELDCLTPSIFFNEKSRIRRLALGSGRSEEDVINLFKRYKHFKKMFKDLKKNPYFKRAFQTGNFDPSKVPMVGMMSRKQQQMYNQIKKMGRIPGMKLKFK